MTEIGMKGEASSACRLKVDSRPPLHKRRGSNKSLSAQEDMNSGCEDNVNNEMSSMETSTVSSTDNHITLEQLNVSRDDSSETKQLKELLLVHLDMITQQQEILMAKDRQIRTLKSEKEALKCRLERMERRMCLLKQKGTGLGGGGAGGGGVTQDLDLHHSNHGSTTNHPHTTTTTTSQHHVRAINFSTDNQQQQQHHRAHKRKSTAEPLTAAKRHHASGSTGSPGGTGGEDYVHHSPRRPGAVTPRVEQQQGRSAFGVRHFSRTPFNPLSDTGNDSDGSRTLSPARGTHKHQDEEPERGILDGVKERLKPVCAPEDAEYFHRTDRMYYVPWEVPLSPETRISPKKSAQDEVKVPCFRVKHIQTGYSMEGTENLDDEIFAKRHSKPELEEKRRKRWDMQRLREQHLYEKLQGKKQPRRIQPVKLTRGKHDKLGEGENPPESFIPDPYEVRYIEICDNVPVSAFGYPVPQLEECEFDLPDFDLDKREHDEVKRSSRKKR